MYVCVMWCVCVCGVCVWCLCVGWGVWCVWCMCVGCVWCVFVCGVCLCGGYCGVSVMFICGVHVSAWCVVSYVSAW